MAGGDSTKERALSFRRNGWAQGWGERVRVGVLDAKERREGVHSGRNTGIHCTSEWVGRGGRGGGRSGEGRSVIMEECGCSQRGRWDGEITRPGVGQRWEEEGRSRQLSSPHPCTAGQAARKFSLHSDRCSFGEGSTMKVSCSSSSVRLFLKSKMSFKWIKHPDLCRVVVVVVVFLF